MKSAAADAPRATSIKLRLKYANRTATTHPIAEESPLSVLEKIAGNVIADNTAYGT